MRDIPQPVIYKEIGTEEAEAILLTRHSTLVLADPRGPHPNENDAHVTRHRGVRWLDMAADFADQDVAENRAVWRGNLHRTALRLAMQTWCNENNVRHQPKLYAHDTAMMTKQRIWGSQNWGNQ